MTCSRSKESLILPIPDSRSLRTFLPRPPDTCGGFPIVKGLNTGVGADVTVYSFPSSLKPVYGEFPVAGHVFFRLRWGAPHTGGHAMSASASPPGMGLWRAQPRASLSGSPVSRIEP